MLQQPKIIGYTLQGQPIYDTVVQSTPRLVAPSPNPNVQVPQPAQQDNGMIWVYGQAEAESYRVAPGSVVPLWDNKEGSNRIYIKSADANGVPQKMQILQYEDITDKNENDVNPQATGVVTLDTVNDLIESKFEELFEQKMRNRNNNHPHKPKNNKRNYEEDVVNE